MMWFVIQFIIGMLIGFAIGYVDLKLCDYVYDIKKRKQNKKIK